MFSAFQESKPWAPQRREGLGERLPSVGRLATPRAQRAPSLCLLTWIRRSAPRGPRYWLEPPSGRPATVPTRLSSESSLLFPTRWGQMGLQLSLLLGGTPIWEAPGHLSQPSSWWDPCCGGTPQESISLGRSGPLSGQLYTVRVYTSCTLVVMTTSLSSIPCGGAPPGIGSPSFR